MRANIRELRHGVADQATDAAIAVRKRMDVVGAVMRRRIAMMRPAFFSGAKRQRSSKYRMKWAACVLEGTFKSVFVGRRLTTGPAAVHA